jgi:hypothetical protein
MDTQNDSKKLTPEESKQIHDLHRQAKEIVQAIGQTEVHKAKLISQLADVEERAHQTINSFGDRLGIPRGAAWHITPDGQVVVVEGATGIPSPVPAQ